MILNKACLFFLGLGLCVSSGFAENTGYKESWIGEKTNFEVLGGVLIDPYVRRWCEKEDREIGQDAPEEKFSIGTLNSREILFNSAQDPGDISSVYLPRIKDDGKRGGGPFLTDLSVQDETEVLASEVLERWKNKSPLLVLSFGDAHMPSTDFVARGEDDIPFHIIKNRMNAAKPEMENFIKYRYEKYCEAVKELLRGYEKPVLFLVCGDGFPREATEDNATCSDYSVLFPQFLSQLQSVLPQGSQVIYSLGNHDVQSQLQLNEFMKALDQLGQEPGRKIQILTSTPSLWNNENLQNRFNTVAYINKNVGVVSYFANMSMGGGRGFCLDVRANETNQGRPVAREKFLQYCWDFFHDGQRLGVPDILFGSPVQWMNFDGLYLKEKKENNNFKKKVGLFGDRSVLNPVSEEMADIFFGTLNKLAQDNPDSSTPLTMVVMAHDYYLRPMIFYEMMSRFVDKYQLDASILKRLNIIICAGHEHSTYYGEKDMYLQGSDKNMYAIPCSFGGAGIYLEGVNVFAGKSGTFPLEEGNEKWITMDARNYDKYEQWLSRKFGAQGQDLRPKQDKAKYFDLDENKNLSVPPEYELPVACENNGVLILTSEKVQ